MSDIDFSEYFYYDETSPSCLRWKVDRCYGKNFNVVVVANGDKAGYLSEKLYWNVELEGRSYKVHRVIWQMFNETMLDVVDHLDGNTTNNKLSNLQTKTRKANFQNRAMPFVNTSGKCGVLWDVPSKSHPKNVYACAIWNDAEGKQRRKKFPVSKLGLLPAFAAACAYRDQMIAALVAQGQHYTLRHGTRAKSYPPENLLA
jgi:hypothetical protein